MHRKGNVVKCFNKLAGELFENAAVAYTLEQYEKCKEKIKDFGPLLYNDLQILRERGVEIESVEENLCYSTGRLDCLDCCR